MMTFACTMTAIPARCPAPFTSRRCSSHHRQHGVVRAAAIQFDGPEVAAPQAISRRPILAAAAAAVAVLAAGPAAPPAGAVSRPQLFREYYDATDAVHVELHKALEIDAADEDAAVRQVAEFREQANKWVGSYRGTMSVGRRSFAETYAAINAISGHYTSRGATAPLPPKTKAGAEKKLASAEAALKKEKAKDATPTPK